MRVATRDPRSLETSDTGGRRAHAAWHRRSAPGPVSYWLVWFYFIFTLGVSCKVKSTAQSSSVVKLKSKAKTINAEQPKCKLCSVVHGYMYALRERPAHITYMYKNTGSRR